MTGTILGAVGVAILLVAFVLNLLRKLTESSTAYLIMNGVGSGLAAVYAFSTNSIPFVVLEAGWCLAAVGRLVAKGGKGSRG